MKKGKSVVEEVREMSGVKHVRMPSSLSTWDSDVEAFTWKDEFYDIEDYRDGGEFIGKACASGSTIKRKNRWRGREPRWRSFRRSPREHILPKFSIFPPIILDDFLKEIPDYG